MCDVILILLQVDFSDTSVIITEPYFNFSSIQESMNEILFEEYQFQSALRTNGESNLTSRPVPRSQASFLVKDVLSTNKELT